MHNAMCFGFRIWSYKFDREMLNTSGQSLKCNSTYRYIIIIASVISAITNTLMSMQVMEENHQAELRRRGADISRLEEQLAQCHIQMNDSETPIPVRILLSKF